MGDTLAGGGFEDGNSGEESGSGPGDNFLFNQQLFFPGEEAFFFNFNFVGTGIEVDSRIGGSFEDAVNESLGAVGIGSEDEDAGGFESNLV